MRSKREEEKNEGKLISRKGRQVRAEIEILSLYREAIKPPITARIGFSFF
jgi:predicted RNA-binding protein YlqC (UPF0109 family)